jgi:hypothetical protein
MDVHDENAEKFSPFTEEVKRQYRRPTLMVFGKVGLMTQSASGSDPNDNATSQGGGTMGPSAMGGSDRAIKENIVQVGDHPLGISLYLFDYKPEFRDQWGHGRQFGVMAQEVETVMPEAVAMHADGYKIVNYTMLGISRTTH